MLWDIKNESFAEANSIHYQEHFQQISSAFEALGRMQSLTAIQSRVLNLAADNIVDGRITLQRIRFRLNREFSTNADDANQAIAQLSPHLAVVEYDYLTLQPLGLLASSDGPRATALLDRALEYMYARYNPEEAQELSLNDCFKSQDFAPFDDLAARRALQFLKLFQLTADTLRGSSSGWSAPQDMEQLWENKVVTINQLHRYSQNSSIIRRPWPNALLKFAAPSRSQQKLTVAQTGSAAVEEEATLNVSKSEDVAAPKLPRLDVKFTNRIGNGAFGTVWAAEDLLLERPLAVKFLTKTLESLDEKALLREARSLAKVSHPNLVTVYGAAWLLHPETHLIAPAIMMELLDGVTLNKWWKIRRSLSQLIGVAEGFIAGVAALHTAQICHTDLHVENVMILQDGSAKIIDWRYQDTIREQPTAHRKELMDVDQRRMCDMLVSIFENSNSPNECALFRGKSTLQEALAAIEALKNGVAGKNNILPSLKLDEAIEGVAKATADSKARIRDYIRWLVSALESTNLQGTAASSSKPSDEILVQSLHDAMPLIAGFDKLVETIVRHEAQVAAVALMAGFEAVLEKHHKPAGYIGPDWHESDFDFFKFAGRELFLIFISKLIRNEQTDILKNVLTARFDVEYLSLPSAQSWIDLNADCRLLDVDRKERLGLNVYTAAGAELQNLHKHDLLAKSAPFDDLCDADFVLAFFDPRWIPRLACYFGSRTPKALRRLKQQQAATQFALQCGLDGIDSLRRRFQEILAKLTSFGPGYLPVWNFTADQIGAG